MAKQQARNKLILFAVPKTSTEDLFPKSIVFLHKPHPAVLEACVESERANKVPRNSGTIFLTKRLGAEIRVVGKSRLVSILYSNISYHVDGIPFSLCLRAKTIKVSEIRKKLKVRRKMTGKSENNCLLLFQAAESHHSQPNTSTKSTRRSSRDPQTTQGPCQTISISS